MPDWVLTIPRLLWSSIRWVTRRFRRYAVDRQALVGEGSEVVTPVIQLVKAIGPLSITWGTDEENSRRLTKRLAQWKRLSGPLMAYANRHPSDRVKALGAEVENVVMADLTSTALLLKTRKTAETKDVFDASERTHAEALEKVELLMNEIRRY